MPAQSASPGHCWRVCDEGFFAVTDSRIVLFGRYVTARSVFALPVRGWPREYIAPAQQDRHIEHMKKNPLNKGVLTENGIGIGPVTPEMVEARAGELAEIEGRFPPEPIEVDYEQAKRELTGEPEMDAEEEALESIPESERWDPVPGSTGHKAPESGGEDEDSEGRSESAQLFEEGVKEAEHNQMLQAAREAEEENADQQ